MPVKKKKSPPKQRSKSPPAQATAKESAAGERLQKILAAAGLGSRRDCEELITTGRVEVNRQVVSELGARADAVRDEIRVDGTPLRQPRRVYYALNKPPGVVCTNYDPSGRTRVIDMIESNERLFTIGRLDRSSEGLILVTNDGDLANRLTHPRYGVEKTYRVEVAGHPTPEELKPLREGVRLAEGVIQVNQLSIRRHFGKSTELEIVLTEGINREIRRVLAKVGHKVLRLTRVAIGRLTLGEMPTGAYRELSPKEVENLLRDDSRAGGAKQAVPKRNRAAARPYKAGTTAKTGPRTAQGSGRAGSGRSETMGGKPRQGKRDAAAPEHRVGIVIPYDDEPQPAQPAKPARKKLKAVGADSAKRPGKKTFSTRRSSEPGKGKRRP